MSCTHPWTVISHLLSANETCSAILDLRDFDFRLTLVRYALLFTLTCAFEAPFVYLQFRQRRWLLWLFALNLATHPLVCWGLLHVIGHLTFAEYVVAAEGFAFLTEFLIASVVLKRPAWWILVGNFVSWTAGSFLSL